MKKVILPLILLFVGVSLVALESAPSDVVGFVKVTCGTGYKPFSVPFTCYDGAGAESLALVDIVGPYMTGGMAFNADKVWNITTGQSAYKTVAGAFSGDFTDLTVGHAYAMQNKHTEFDMYLAGKVENDVVVYGAMASGYNPVGFKSGGETALADLDLVSSGFTGGMAFNSDKIWDLTTGGSAYYNANTSIWSGDFTTIIPGHAYAIQVKNTPFDWTFDPTSRGDNANSGIDSHNVNRTRR